MPLDPDDVANDFIFDGLREYFVNSAEALAGETPLGKALKIYSITNDGKDVLNRIDIAYHDPNFSNEMKMAIAVLSIMNLAHGNPMIVEMPITVAQAWHYVFDVPDEYIDGFNSKYVTKEAFWADLHSRFPDDFQLDGSGQLIEPTYVSYPPSTPDWSMPLTPPVPGPLPAPVHDHVQPSFSSAVSASSPLVIDLSASHTGVTLTTWNSTSTETYFDLNDNGFAVQTAWVSGTTGLLARDLDSDGVISSSAELFGSPTVDGFAKLAALDSNHDLRIDNNDDAWSSLVVWQDANGDAVTQSGELHSLASLGIASIDLAGVASSTSTISGNPISHVSKVTFTSGATAAIDDAWFVHDNTNSYYTGDYTLDVETLFLPSLRGYGALPDLTIAMSQDSDLKDIVADFASNFTLGSFSNAATLNADLANILYAWAGVTDVDPNGRGAYMDGQQLAFLEKLVGSDFYQPANASSNPLSFAALTLTNAYQNAFDMLSADLLLQVGAGSLFAGTVTYNAASGTFSGNTALSQTAISSLSSIAPAPGQSNLDFWEAIGRFIDNTRGFSNLTVSERGWLDAAVQATDSSLHWTDVLHEIANDTPGNTINGTTGADTLSGGTWGDTINANFGVDVVHGNGGNDEIHGGGDADTLYGDAGNDTIYGEDGNDTLYGGDGNDILWGGAGNNTFDGGLGGNFLHGSSGNDTYVYSGGNDVIEDTGGTDIITLPSGITLGDLSFNRVVTYNNPASFDDLLITIDGGGTIELGNQFNSVSSYHFETIVFSDSSTLTLSSLSGLDYRLSSANDYFASNDTGNFTVYGLDGNDYLYTAQGGVHTFDGGNGNDTLKGGTGSDTYIASPGFDIIQDTAGSDTIVVPDGFGIGDVVFYRINNSSGPTSDLGIIINGLGEIDVQNHFAGASSAVESLHFLSDNSTVSLTSLSITTIGTSGNDTLTPPGANASTNDILDGREGNDTLYGGFGNDTYVFSAGHDKIDESSRGGDDTIKVREIYDPSDVTLSFVQDTVNNNNFNMQLTDSDGNTMLIYHQGYASDSVIEHIVFGDGTVWNLSAIEVASYGTTGNDTMAGHDYGDASSDDTIYGLAGNDNINGGAGNDLVYGGDGADTIYALVGSDIIFGDAGDDTLIGQDHATLHGGDGNDNISNTASSSPSSHSVVMYGDGGSDIIHAGAGTNYMNGGAGADTLYGSSSGTDTFAFDAATAFSGVDSIQQFNKAGGDKIDISDVLDGHYNPATDVITNFVQITTNGSNSELYVDTTGTATFGTAQHIATISGVTGLTDEAALVTAGTLIAA